MRRIGSGDDEGRTLSTEKRRRKMGEGWRASTSCPVAFYEPPADSPARHTASLVRGNRQIAHPHSDPQYHFSLAPALLLLSLHPSLSLPVLPSAAAFFLSLLLLLAIWVSAGLWVGVWRVLCWHLGTVFPSAVGVGGVFQGMSVVLFDSYLIPSPP